MTPVVKRNPRVLKEILPSGKNRLRKRPPSRAASRTPATAWVVVAGKELHKGHTLARVFRPLWARLARPRQAKRSRPISNKIIRRAPVRGRLSCRPRSLGGGDANSGRRCRRTGLIKQ